MRPANVTIEKNVKEQFYMSEREKVYRLFEEQNDFYSEKVNQGIEAYRKGNGHIRILDKNGAPVANARINLTQKGHEFRFGANLFMLDELETYEKNESYKECFAELFNMATLPFYWRDLEPEIGKQRYAKNSPKIYRRPAPDLCIEYCEKHGIEPREHALAYEQWFPRWLKGKSTEYVKRELERRYAEIAERYADKIPTIEVTNEMIGWWDKYVTDFYNDPDYVPYCFKLAEKYFPNNELCINEATPFCWTDRPSIRCAYYSYIENALLKGARIDAIGMQYHIFKEQFSEGYFELLDLKNLYRHMELFAKLGKPLEITEVTVPSYSWNEEDEQLQAEILERLYSLWFSHPAVKQIVYWNVVDGYAHLWSQDREKIRASQGNMGPGSENFYHGGLLRYDMSKKPAYYKLKELLLHRWHTEKVLMTDSNGCAEFRGFFGDYGLEITKDGKLLTECLTLSSKCDNSAEFILK